MNQATVIATPTTLIELVRHTTRRVRDLGFVTNQKKIKEAIAQGYGYHCYNACFYDTNGRIPNMQFIEPSFWRVLGYPEGQL